MAPPAMTPPRPAPLLLLVALIACAAASTPRPRLACVRNPAGAPGVAERCGTALALRRGANASFALTVTPRDVGNQAWDVEVTVTSRAGNVDL